MLLESVRAILLRDLATMRREIDAYPDDASVWATPPGIANPAGTLALHVAGNLRHFVGARLGDTGYVRDRPAEFSRRDVPRAEIAAELAEAHEVVGRVLAGLSEEKLREPLAILPELSVKSGDFLVHLSGHLTYHLGQVDYHRRLVTGDGSTVDALSIPEMASAAPPDGASA